MPLLAPVTSAAQFSMAPKVPAKPAWWQAAAAFQPVRTPNFAERTVARHNPVTNTRRAHRRRSVLEQSFLSSPLEARRMNIMLRHPGNGRAVGRSCANGFELT